MATAKKKETPLMKQHREIKSRYPDAILLFRVGDFYETFGEDARTAATVLGITLTKRSNGAAAAVELAGFPHHSLNNYLHKLVRAGHRVAVCDQLENPKTAKGIVKRGVTDLVTPGLTTADNLLNHKANNFLAAFYQEGTEAGVSFVDISTGTFYSAEGKMEYIDKLIQSFMPAEIILAKGQQKTFSATIETKAYTYGLEDWIFQLRYARETLASHYQMHSLKGFGLDDAPLATITAAAVLHYLKETQHAHLDILHTIERLRPLESLWMDRFTIRNLELLPQPDDGQHRHSLLEALDQTQTPMGARWLRHSILFPLTDPVAIGRRLDQVEWFHQHPHRTEPLRQCLQSLGDLERLAAKVSLQRVNPREMVQLGHSLYQSEQLREILEQDLDAAPLQSLRASLRPTAGLLEEIRRQLKPDAPAQTVKGGVIAEGVNAELDELRALAQGGKQYLLDIQRREAERTQIHSLKVSYNNVFGYYLEVTHAHREKVPSDWIRKQTLTNAERYITPELKEYEEKILGAEEKILDLESRLFEEFVAAVAPRMNDVQHNAQIIAQIDLLSCFARNAEDYHYVKPRLIPESRIEIKGGRHPVIEQVLPPGQTYVANDLILNKDDQQIILLSGPNMSGKSALLRQTALITLMAHMGSFVPATSADIGLTDKIFTRVGASDNLSGGESTFMVEMNETASIMNGITEKSLVILDEIGRGTSTFDGISLAWAIVDYLSLHPHRPLTLFATHYHELNEMEEEYHGVRNYHISHKEAEKKVLFLRKLKPGGSRHSFGIQVARMAGMPEPLLSKAESMLSRLESIDHGKGKVTIQEPGAMQLELFEVPDPRQALRDELENYFRELDVNGLTPVEALVQLHELKKKWFDSRPTVKEDS